MRIIGCDLHARQQSVAMLNTETGEVVNRTLMHEGHEVREFYSQLPRPVLVGIEAIGPMQWFLKLFCRRGQKPSGAACAGMLEVENGANAHRPVD